MSKKQLKEYAITIEYPMDLWRDGYSIAKLKRNIYGFYSRLAMYLVIQHGGIQDNHPNLLAAISKRDKIKLDLNIID